MSKELTSHKLPFDVLYWIIATAYIVSIGLTEFALNYLSVLIGLALYFIILITAIAHSTLDHNKPTEALWLTLGLIPIIRIISFIIRVEEFYVITWYILIGVLLLVAIYTLTRQMRYSLDDIGLNSRYLLVQITIAASGPILGIIDYMILKPEPLVEGSIIQLVYPALVLLVFTGLVEELAFRGVLQKSAGALGSWGWLLVAPVYALLQTSYRSLPHSLFTLGVALYFGFAVDRTKSVIGVSLAHGLLNIVLLIVMPNSMGF